MNSVHRLTDPAPDGLATMAAALGSGFRVVNVRRLTGGAMAAHLIEVADGSNRREVVLKRYPPEIPSAENEWDALCFAHSAGLPSPEPLLCDPGGWFGAPAIVMSALPGSLCQAPTDVEGWATALADVLASIHDIAIDDVPISMDRPGIWTRWDASGLAPGPRTDAISAAIDELRVRTWMRSFCHCDFHPGNVLFCDGAVVGVVDWASARPSPFLNDLGRLRAAIAILGPGVDTADLLGAAYSKRTGRSLDGLAYWDLLTGALTLQSAESGQLTLHLQALNLPVEAPEAVRRAIAFIDAALARIESA